MNRKKRDRFRKKTFLKRVLWLAAFLLSAILLFSVYKLIRIIKSYRESSESYRAVANAAVTTTSPAPSASPDAENTAALPEVPIVIDWEQLKKTNGDIVAWLYCADTPINYPIVQAKDNEFYLTHGFDGKKGDSGALFLDCRNNIAANDENFIVYGHRMKDDSMFGTIPQYAEESYYIKHPTLYLLTPEQNYRVGLFACRTVHSEEKYFETSFESKKAFQRYLNKAIEQSYWPSDTPAGTDYSSLTLVTCSTYANTNNPRLLVHGCLTPVS